MMNADDRHRHLNRAHHLVRQHRRWLWWIHSGYALLAGIGFMWLGTIHFEYLRVAVAYIAFIWITSLLLPRIVAHPRLPAGWRGPIRSVIHYLHRNLYQQILFFILPLYWISTTIPSRNSIFLILLAGAAVLSTLDTVYEHRLSAHWHIMALFFAFNTFATLNLMLPVLWGISNSLAVTLSGGVAVVAVASFIIHLSGMRPGRKLAMVTVSIILLSTFIFVGRPLVPPAPLKLTRTEFGTAFTPSSLSMQTPIDSLPAGYTGPVYILTAIRAPLGLKDEVQQRWYLDGRLVYESPLYTIEGGRQAGYRLWTRCHPGPGHPGEQLIVEVVTRGDQLIGRSSLPITPVP